MEKCMLIYVKKELQKIINSDKDSTTLRQLWKLVEEQKILETQRSVDK